ncbi:S26 family signal peptidase [Bailinhaonella thermotolerans]|uniref:S26 family signal peptidase n=2 Tax=Bailinhaonella thermotolerans TaxID=1070861 RepID=A0A3A4A7Y7_9ACTN|nr:S26 family signal peptidase [Bailinhaonella thermotolerans]
MEPALREGDRLLVRRATPDRVRPGDIVVLRIRLRPQGEVYGATAEALPPAETAHDVEALPPDWTLLVKRAIAVPGDPVPRDRAPALAAVPEPRVPDDALVVLGDNPTLSWDSRDYGYVRPGQLVGVALRRLPLRTPHTPAEHSARPTPGA